MLTRRRFFAATGATAVGAAVAGCTDEGTGGGVSGPASTETSAPVDRARRYFTPQEAAAVEAATARILPGTPDDPGAREAEVVVYIDALLASGGWGNEPVYRMGPFPAPDEAEAPGGDVRFGDDDSEEDEAEQGGGSPDFGTSSHGVVRRPIGSFDRYGEQSILTPPEVYRTGIASMNAHARQRFGSSFADLAPAEQDAVLVDMEDGNATTFDAPSGEDFFVLLRQHTIEGMFSDPMYGGNRDMVGWKLVGWPGSQRSYSPEEMLSDAPPRPPQSLAGLPHFHGGRSGERDEPVSPLAGSESGVRRGGR